jgi:lipopolysaccharide export system permease protein
LKFLEVIVHNNVSVQGYLSLIVYLLPDLFVKVAPICTLIGSILAYSKLTIDNELQVMQTLGKSPWQIIRPGAVIATALTVFLLFLNIFTIPSAFRAFRNQEFQLRNQFSSSLVREGGFNTVRGLTIFVEKRLSAKEFEGVFIHNNGKNSNEKSYTIFAKKGILKKVGDKYVLGLQQGVRQEKDRKNIIHSFEFESIVYDLDDFTNIVNSRGMKPYERDLRDLLQIDSEKIQDEKLRIRLAAEGHQRLLLPFLCIINILLVALVMVVNRPSRRLRRKRMVILIFSGIIFQWFILNLLQLQLRFKFSVFLAYAIVSSIIFAAGIFLKNGSIHHKLQKAFDKCGI